MSIPELKDRPHSLDYIVGYQRATADSSVNIARIQDRALAMGFFIGLPVGGLALYVYLVLVSV